MTSNTSRRSGRRRESCDAKRPPSDRRLPTLAQYQTEFVAISSGTVVGHNPNIERASAGVLFLHAPTAIVFIGYIGICYPLVCVRSFRSLPAYRQPRPPNPPAPYLDITVWSVGRQRRQFVQALLDTGADQSVIPERIARNLQLQKTRDKPVMVIDFEGKTSRRFEYSAEIEIRGIPGTKIVAVIGGQSDDDACIGRDLLNDLVITLNGPNGLFEVSIPSSSGGAMR